MSTSLRHSRRRMYPVSDAGSQSVVVALQLQLLLLVLLLITYCYRPLGADSMVSLSWSLSMYAASAHTVSAYGRGNTIPVVVAVVFPVCCIVDAIADTGGFITGSRFAYL